MLQKIRTIAYLSLVHPILEYSSAVWDPHSTTDVLYIEKIQRRAARWTTSELCLDSSVRGSVLNDLQWPTLSSH